jgi:hypothetical protein
MAGFLVGSVFLAAPASAQQTIHVNGACGDDAWTGLAATCQAPDGPKRTILAGVDAAGPGDTVLVAPGTYSGPGNVDFSLSGGEGLTLRSEAGPVSTTINGTGAIGWLWVDTEGGAVIDGFGVTGFVGGQTPIGIGHRGDLLIVNCRFYGNEGHTAGAIFQLDDAPPSTLRVVNCIFAHNSGWAGAIYHRGFYTPLEIVNCTFVGGEGMIASAVWTTTQASFTNSIFRGEPPQLYGGMFDCPVAYCNVEGEWGYSLIDAGGNIDADPLFADPGAGDYRLLPGSPCIDAADNTEVPDGLTIDIAGLPRFVDDPATEDTGVGPPPVVDMGAHEFQGAGCYPDFTGDGALDLFDFLAFVNAFNANDPAADCIPDGVFDLFDFLCFVNAFNEGC